MKLPVYLDCASTTPVDPRVRGAMNSCLAMDTGFANPSSTHAPGREAHTLVETARSQVADLINASPEEIVWTSGATESDNLGIIGAARFRRGRGRHLVTSTTEHKAVLESFRYLEGEGFAVSYIEPDRQGRIILADVDAAISSDTTLVSIMHANNEIGVEQDIVAIGALCRARDVLFHVDAAQTAGRLKIDIREQNIDLLSLTAHKVYGPKGIGALFLNRERIRRVEPLFHGGAQERGLRPGTLPTHQCVGMGEAFRLARLEMGSDVTRVAALRDRLWAGIADVPGIVLNGDFGHRVCSILCVSFDGVEGESLLFGLRNLAVTSGAACNSASGEPSYVLRSLGHSDQLAQSSIRFSLGRFTTAEEIDYAVSEVRDTVARLQTMLPGGSVIVNG